MNPVDEMKKLLEDNFELISNMSVEEYTLYRKWLELNSLNLNHELMNKVKSNIWSPSSPEDYKRLNIKVIPVNNDERAKIWDYLRRFTSSAIWTGSIGRSCRYYIVHEERSDDPFGFGFGDTYEHKYLGCISLGSDFMDIRGRDMHLKWTREDKTTHNMLRHTAMGSSIVPTQPLGFNYVGGKLISLLTVSSDVEDFWNSKYEEELLGVTTTSLYGGFSQYNGLKYWKKCKSTTGQIIIEPSDEVYKNVREIFRENFPEEYKNSLEFPNGKKKSHPKTKLLGAIYKMTGVKPPKNNAPRGVYWCSLYEDTDKYLRREVDCFGTRRFDNKTESLVNLWKEKYAEKRIKNIIENDKFSGDTLFYDGMVGVDWEEAKRRYLNDVGR